MKNHLDKKIEMNALSNFVVSKIKDEPNHYKFIGFVAVRSNLAKRIVAEQSLNRELDADFNPVGGKNRQKLLTGRDGLRNFERTGPKLSMVFNSLIDNSEQKKEIAEKNRILKEKRAKEFVLRKLRRKFFDDRQWMMLGIDNNGGTDNQWDEFLWENQGRLQKKNSNDYKAFEREFKMLGL